MRRLLILLLAFCCGAGCAARAQRPRDALRDFADALQRGDYGRAYDLMSERYRATHPRDEFVRALAADPDEARATAEALRRDEGGMEVHAELAYGEDERMNLVIDGGQWRIDSDPLAFYSQATPRDALRTFLRAAERKRYDVLLRLVPYDLAQGLTAAALEADFEGNRRAELERLLRALREHVDDPIEETGDVATLPYGDHYEVRFLREDGRWKLSKMD